MLEAEFKSGETIFFANGAIVESHICMGSFEAEGEIKYVITPYGKVNTLPSEKSFRTFEEAKKSIVEAADKIAEDAKAQAERVRDFKEEEIVVLPNTVPTETEMKADEAK